MLLITSVLTLPLVVAMVLVFSGPVCADQFNIYPTIPGTGIRDFGASGFRVDTDRGTLQPTLPGTNIRDWSRGGYRIEGDRLLPTIPGTNIRDFSQPGFVIE